MTGGVRYIRGNLSQSEVLSELRDQILLAFKRVVCAGARCVNLERSTQLRGHRPKPRIAVTVDLPVVALPRLFPILGRGATRTPTGTHTVDIIPVSTYYRNMNHQVGERGQVTIPKTIRDHLGITPGMALEVHEEAGAVVFRKPGIGPALERWSGSAKNPFPSTDELLRSLRDGE